MLSTKATQILIDTLKNQQSRIFDPFPWGVAYSGGRDSAVLLWGLVKLVGSENLVALHVDHGWRPAAERVAEKSLVDNWCQKLGVSVESFSPPKTVSFTEAGAREHRYACFQKFLASNPQSPIFLAHHADDQAETILMRILRGRSWQGLAGMAERRGPFIRPLLSLGSNLLKQVATENQIPYHEDSTNFDISILRNYLRLKVFPVILERFPRSVGALNDLATIWSHHVPKVSVHQDWILDSSGGKISSLIWESWSVLERQNQLLAVASLMDPNLKMSRKFLETATSEGHCTRVSGTGWSWSKSADRVTWERVVQTAPKEYFVVAVAGVVYDLGDHVFFWDVLDNGFSPGIHFEWGGFNPERPLVWRSAVSGGRYCSVDDGDWGKEKRRKRLGGSYEGNRALAVQDGVLKAVVETESGKVLWSEKGPLKLNNTKIFVTLVLRSDYERR